MFFTILIAITSCFLLHSLEKVCAFHHGYARPSVKINNAACVNFARSMGDTCQYQSRLQSSRLWSVGKDGSSIESNKLSPGGAGSYTTDKEEVPRTMDLLKFGIPTLGIWLLQPILSLIGV